MSTARNEECVCNKSGLDYYGILSLKKECNDLEIKEAFRRLAILYNPDRRKDANTEAMFALVAEAYDVLSDALKRAVYDQYGEEGLKTGVPDLGRFIKPYVYHGQPKKTYREFFGSETPYPGLLNSTIHRALLEFPEGRGVKRKEEPLIKTLYLTLSEIFFGGIKKMKIQRLVLVGDDKSTTVAKEKILTIPIKPGIPSGTKIIFPEAGDQGPAKIPADVIFITEDQPHEKFRRVGSDLYMTLDIFLQEALTGTVFTVVTLDDRILRIPITSIVAPDYQKRVIGEGLPLPENPKEKGDLIIKFNIEFPVYLPLPSKNYIKRAFELTCAPKNAENTQYIQHVLMNNKIYKNVDIDVPLRRRYDDETSQLRSFCNS